MAATRSKPEIADIPMLPVLSWADLHVKRGAGAPTVLDLPGARFVTSGRVAIAQALSLAEVGRDCEVLLPAYHCPSMVQPVLWAQARPVFYRINADTSPDVDDIESRISSATRAILAAHFFGLTFDFTRLRAICDERDIVLIEDCAHTISRSIAGSPVGTFGDFVIASPRKFLPTQDGGLIYSRKGTRVDTKLERLGIRYELKIALNTLEYASQYGRMGLMGSIAAYIGGRDSKENARNSDKSDDSQKSTIGMESEYVDKRFDRRSINGRMSAFSKVVLRSLSLQDIFEARQRNFKILKDNLSELANGRLLFDLNDGRSVPYIVPVEIDRPEKDHGKLLEARVPVWRWEYLASGVCPQSNYYSQSLLQFPCHQSLSDQELEVLIDRIKAVLN